MEGLWYVRKLGREGLCGVQGVRRVLQRLGSETDEATGQIRVIFFRPCLDDLNALVVAIGTHRTVDVESDGSGRRNINAIDDELEQSLIRARAIKKLADTITKGGLACWIALPV